MMISVMLNGLTKGQGKMILLCSGGQITRLPLNVLPSAQQPQPHSQETENTRGGQNPVPGLVPLSFSPCLQQPELHWAAPALPLACSPKSRGKEQNCFNGIIYLKMSCLSVLPQPPNVSNCWLVPFHLPASTFSVSEINRKLLESLTSKG